MSKNCQIHFINKNPRLDRYHAIVEVGGTSPNNWRVPLQRAVDLSNLGEYKFFTWVNGTSVWVDVATSPAGNEYLRTENDGTTVDNLLSLPQFPAHFPLP